MAFRYFFIACFLAVASGFPAAPSDFHRTHPDVSQVCESMYPGHNGNKAQDSDIPYVLNVDKTKVAPDGLVTLTFSGISEKKFKGLMVEARDGNNIIGEFQLPEGSPSSLRLLNCPGGEKNAVSLIGKEDNDSATIIWKAPSTAHKEVKIYVTVVEKFDIFWVKVPMKTIEVKTP